MTKVITDTPIRFKKEICPGLYVFRLWAPEIAQAAQPGQFLEIDPGEGFFLRRPFSIQDAEGEAIEVLVKVVGAGTQKLVEREDDWNILGPLGNAFSHKEGREPVLVGGGVGVAPLKFLANTLKREGIGSDFLVGARAAGEIPFDADDSIRESLLISTDDGSEGFPGTVVGLLEKSLDKYANPYIYACGPLPMLKALRELMLANDLEGEFSLENRMACGMGVCQGCAIPMNQGYRLVCSEGPVFDYRELGERFWI